MFRPLLPAMMPGPRTRRLGRVDDIADLGERRASPPRRHRGRWLRHRWSPSGWDADRLPRAGGWPGRARAGIRLGQVG